VYFRSVVINAFLKDTSNSNCLTKWRILNFILHIKRYFHKGLKCQCLHCIHKAGVQMEQNCNDSFYDFSNVVLTSHFFGFCTCFGLNLISCKFISGIKTCFQGIVFLLSFSSCSKIVNVLE
jgi:hypothetical protein